MPGPPPPTPPASKRKTPAPAGRGQLLSQIQGGAKLKKTVTVDKSAPVLSPPKSSTNASSGSSDGGSAPSSSPMGGMGGLFSGGIPKLKSTAPTSVAPVLKSSKVVPPKPMAAPPVPPVSTPQTTLKKAPPAPPRNNAEPSDGSSPMMFANAIHNLKSKPPPLTRAPPSPAPVPNKIQTSAPKQAPPINKPQTSTPKQASQPSNNTIKSNVPKEDSNLVQVIRSKYGLKDLKKLPAPKQLLDYATGPKKYISDNPIGTSIAPFSDF